MFVSHKNSTSDFYGCCLLLYHIVPVFFCSNSCILYSPALLHLIFFFKMYVGNIKKIFTAVILLYPWKYNSTVSLSYSFPDSRSQGSIIRLTFPRSLFPASFLPGSDLCRSQLILFNDTHCPFSISLHMSVSTSSRFF